MTVVPFTLLVWSGGFAAGLLGASVRLLRLIFTLTICRGWYEI